MSVSTISKRGVALLAFGLVTTAPHAAEPAAPRPSIGLALSGGGARGAAHVGVLEVLEELHVPVDAIAGTSMGAMIGGLYAAGVPAERIERVLRESDWADLLDDRPAYRDLVFRRKEDASRYLLDFELGIHDGKLAQPRGLRAGQKLAFEARALLIGTRSESDFTRLPIPFRAAATDVETGERVVLDHGDLVESILASLAIPGVFAPVEIDGRLLVDGGMVDNLPVDLARAAGADLVIAVDVGTPLAKRDKLGSFFSVLGQTTTFLTRKNSERSLAAADLVVTPDLAGISSGGFADAAEAITRGRNAALAAREALARYALDEDAWREYLATRRPAPTPAGPIARIRVEGNQRVDSRVILGRMHTQLGEPLDPAALREDLGRVFGLDDFQRVTLDVESGAGGETLVLKVQEKAWGPTYVRFGLEAVDDLEGDARYGVRASVTTTRLNALGAEWRNDVQIGSQQLLRSEFFQPFDFRGRFFIAPWVQAQREQQPIYEGGQRLAEYDVKVAGGGVDGGIQFGRFGELRLGVDRTKVHARVDTGPGDLPRFDVNEGSVRLRFAYSSLDRPTIATDGGEIRAGANFARRALGSDVAYDRAFGGASRFFGRGRHTGFVIVDGGTNLGSTIPPYDEFALGGLFSLGGYSEGQFRGQLYGTAKLGYHFRIAALPAGLGAGVYVGALVEAGNVWDHASDISMGDLLYGATAILGADTLAGPLFLAYAAGEGGSRRVYLTIGRTF